MKFGALKRVTRCDPRKGHERRINLRRMTFKNMSYNEKITVDKSNFVKSGNEEFFDGSRYNFLEDGQKM